MDKRGFLRGLLGMVGTGIAAGAKAAPPRRVLIQQSALAGFQYHAG